jgi:hypothetical protein
MNTIHQRSALSAFVWTTVVMSLAGALVFWSADAIPALPSIDSTTQYVEALDLANARLSEASTRIQQLENQVQHDQNTRPTTNNRSPQVAVDANQAITIADQVAGRYHAIKDPQLVDFEGIIAWAVTYEPGIIYVNSTSGEIIFVERSH